MSIRIPTYERHVQLDSGAQTIPRYKASDEIGRALSGAGNSIIALGAHLQKKQEQFDTMQFNQRMLRAKQDADLAFFEEQQKYDPHVDPPGAFHDRVQSRVNEIYKNVYSTVPDHLKPTAQAHIATATNHYSDTAAKNETQSIVSAAQGDLDKIVAGYKLSAKGNPDSAKDAIVSMRQSVDQMKGSFSDGQRRALSRQYEDQIAEEAVKGYQDLKQFDAAKSFATEYAKQRDQFYGPGRVGPQSDAGDKLGEGGAHGYARGGTQVEPWLVDTVRQAAKTLPDGYRAEVISTVDSRSTGTPWHPSGRAIDIQIYDDKGNKVPNLGPPSRPGWDVYENMAAAAKAYAQDKYNKVMTWGGHFNTGTAFDRMHFQSGGQSARNFSPQKLEEGRNAINDALTTGGTKTVTDPATGKKTKSSDLTPETPIPDRLNAGVVDEQGNKIVVDPKTGKMMKQSDLEQPPVKVASAAVGGISDAPPPEAKAPAPVDPSKYETKLSPADEKKFQAWKAQYAPNDSGQDYDLRGAFKAGAKPDPDTGHMPDTWKKPNHPTFSDQSQYAKDRPDLAGHWDGETYVPPAGQTPQQAVIPLPQPRPSFANAVPAAVPQTEGQAWLNSKLTQIDSSIMKAQSVKSTMNKSLNNVLSADIASRQESGVPVTLSPDLQRYYGTNQLSYEFVSNHLGEGKAIEWEQAKEQADRNYSGVAHMELMPASDIHDRVESLRPVPGSPDYVKQRLSFVHAQKEEDRILKLRESDPAKAADMLDGPKSALENYKKDPTPENGQALTAARMEAQKYLEVDDAVRTPLTNQEASHLAKPFNNKGLLDPAGAANAAMTKLRELVGGDDDALKRGVAQILKQKGINDNAATMMSIELSKQNKAPAQSISPSTAPSGKSSLFPTAPEIGTIDPITGQIVPKQNYDARTGEVYSGPPDSYADRDTGLFDPLNSDAVDHVRLKSLLKNPSAEAADFDKTYGSGASAYFIQSQNTLSREGKTPIAEVDKPWTSVLTGPDTTTSPPEEDTTDADPYKPSDTEDQ